MQFAETPPSLLRFDDALKYWMRLMHFFFFLAGNNIVKYKKAPVDPYLYLTWSDATPKRLDMKLSTPVDLSGAC